MHLTGRRIQPNQHVHLMSSNKRIHLPFLDGIRGIAILAVFFYHSLGESFGFDKLKWDGLIRDFDTSASFLALYPFTYGNAGVAIFFVVSGFCIHLSYLRSKEKSWLLFANKRLFRIYPPYLFALLLFFFVWPWGTLRVDSFSQVAQFVTHLFSIHNFERRTLYGINPSFWSIAVEVQLYAIYPLLIMLSSKIGWQKSLSIAAVCEVSIRLALSIVGMSQQIPLIATPVSAGLHVVISSPFAYWLSWALGAYLCECYLKKQDFWLFKLRFDVALLIAILTPMIKPAAPFTFLAFSLLTAIAIHRLMFEKWSLPNNRLFKIAWSHLSLLGVISYSFYLLHQPIIGLTDRLVGYFASIDNVHPLFLYALCMAWYPLVFAASYAMYRCVEKPSINLGRSAWSRLRPAQPAV